MSLVHPDFPYGPVLVARRPGMCSLFVESGLAPRKVAILHPKLAGTDVICLYSAVPLCRVICEAASSMFATLPPDAYIIGLPGMLSNSSLIVCERTSAMSFFLSCRPLSAAIFVHLSGGPVWGRF